MLKNVFAWIWMRITGAKKPETEGFQVKNPFSIF